ncbi:MAG TPA: hypothetical protein VI282_13495 [Verrucomicrobiae bacterium]|jgi:hypothetical protein
MEPQIQAYWVPKLGNSTEEYEDAFAYSTDDGIFAIADGATESSFADRWARDLVDSFVTKPPEVNGSSAGFPEWLVPMQQRWRQGIDWENLPWFAEEKAKVGAFATFLGLHIYDPENLRKASLLERAAGFFRKKEQPQLWKWKAVAVGDSCVFQIRDDQMIACFPISKADQFSSRPVLLCSNPANNTGVWPEIRFEQGDCKGDDLFVLATDAVAKWFLDQHELGGKPWDILTGVRSQMEFQDIVARLRSEKAMRNDDATVVLCTWKSTAPKLTKSISFRKTQPILTVV